jgi:MFS transporter, PPP family, 3-phenylpropionic acid transporter
LGRVNEFLGVHYAASVTVQAAHARATYAALFAAIGALVPFIPVYYQSLGIALDGIGLLGAVAAAAAAVAAPLWGAAADRLGSTRRVLLLGSLGAAASAVVLGRVAPGVPLLVAVVLLYAFIAGVSAVLDAQALEQIGADRNQYGQLRVWGSASFIVSVLAVGWLVERTDIRAIFVVLAAAMVATALAGGAIRGRSTLQPAPARSGLNAVLGSPVLRPFLLAVVVAWSASTAVNAFLSIHLLSIGASSGLVGGSWAIGALVEVPVMLGFASLANRLGVERLIVAGAAAMLLRGLALLALRDPILATATMGLHGIGFALLLVGGVVYVSRHAPAGAAAASQGVLGATVFGVAAIAGPGAAGLLAQALGVEGMFAVACIVSLMGLAALAVVLGPMRSRAPAAI